MKPDFIIILVTMIIFHKAAFKNHSQGYALMKTVIRSDLISGVNSGLGRQLQTMLLKQLEEPHC